jgi:WD40 repeat protein
MATVGSVPDDTDDVAGQVWGMAQAGDRTIIGGLFTEVGGVARSNAAAIGADGKVDGLFDPGVNGKVMAVAASEDGSTIFLGGTFTQAGGAQRANLAAVDAVTGQALVDWTANTSGTYPDVTSLAVHGQRLYVAGRFAGIDGTTRKRLVAINTATGNIIPTFKPAANANVREVVVSPDGATVYAGGTFTMLGGQPRLYAGAVSAATGTATSFAPTGSGGTVVTIGLSPDGGRFFYGTHNNTLYAYDPAASNDPVWLIKTSGNTQAIAVSNDEMWIGGHFSQILTGKIPRPFIASLDPVDGSVNEWNPECRGGSYGVWALLLEGTHLHVGGVFTGFGTIDQPGYARFSQV